METKKFLIVIPARSGSKGIVGKNFRMLGKSPVINYSINHAKLFQNLCDIVVSTDNLEYIDSTFQPEDLKENPNRQEKPIREITPGFYIHHRAKNLSLDETSIILVLQDVLKTFMEMQISYEGILLLQPTVPFRKRVDAEYMTEFLLNRAGEDNSFVTFKKVNDSHPARMYRKQSSNEFVSAGFFKQFEQVRRQDLPDLYLRDGCYYYIGKNLVSTGNQIGGNPEGYEREFPWNINLDELTDLIVAESVVENHVTELNHEGLYQ
jgi:CMP-N,N'-diacetyllegionaminic acid synthase